MRGVSKEANLKVLQLPKLGQCKDPCDGAGPTQIIHIITPSQGHVVSSLSSICNLPPRHRVL